MKPEFGIKSLVIENGKVESIGFTGGVRHHVFLAAALLNTAMNGVQHMQRPLQRKFNSLIAKVNALADDLKVHEQYVAELKARETERKNKTLCRQIDNILDDSHGQHGFDAVGRGMPAWLKKKGGKDEG